MWTCKGYICKHHVNIVIFMLIFVYIGNNLNANEPVSREFLFSKKCVPLKHLEIFSNEQIKKRLH